jgi:DNA-binding CsgD family transcriptional regulator
MHLSALQTRQLAAVMQVLTEPGHSADSLRQHLVEPIAQLLNADYVASLVWDAPSARFGRGVCCRTDAGHLRAYEAQFQFDDPIAPRLHPRHFPTRVTQVMPQRELVKSEFFERFLGPGDMYWGVNLYAHDGQRDLGDLRIWRAHARHNYNDDELALLRLLYPSLVNALARVSHDTPGHADAASPGEPPMQRLVVRHGLSPREAQVAERVARGLGDKAIAQQMGVAYTTVRTYLSQALHKTGCANRKALIAYVCSMQ